MRPFCSDRGRGLARSIDSAVGAGFQNANALLSSVHGRAVRRTPGHGLRAIVTAMDILQDRDRLAECFRLLDRLRERMLDGTRYLGMFGLDHEAAKAVYAAWLETLDREHSPNGAPRNTSQADCSTTSRATFRLDAVALGIDGEHEQLDLNEQLQHD